MSYDLWGRLRYMLSPQFDIYEQVSKVIHGNVIDIGSGTGFGTHLFVRNADNVVGCEIDDTALKFSQKTFSNGKVSFHSLDITQPIAEADYDFVTMIDVIEHINDHRKAVRNCKNLLKDNGTFIVSTPNRLSRYRKSEYHVREYSPAELNQILEGVFDDVSLMDYQLKPLESDYTNPILAVCL